jgi:hypothetical protein
MEFCPEVGEDPSMGSLRFFGRFGRLGSPHAEL